MRGCLLALAFLILDAVDLRAQGYVLEEGRMVVAAPEHWRAWTFPEGTLTISDEGRVIPQFVRKEINAVSNAVVMGGGVTAGSNPGLAEHVLDGDPTTSWTPDLDAPRSEWWIEIDLGRVVSAAAIVIRFDEREDVDPFRQFEVFTSGGESAFVGSNKRLWRLAFRTKRLDRDRRVYEIPLYPWEKSSEEWTGTVLQYVRVEVTDSGLGRAEEVSEETYRSLPPSRRGEVQHYRRTGMGWERPVDEEGYQALPPELQGSIRYYRWERPRLAEVEVHAFGDNVALGVLSRGGSVREEGTTYNPYLAFDGDYLTHWMAMPFVERRGGEVGRLIADLGATFWVDRMRVVCMRMRLGEGLPLQGYTTRSSDGTLAPDGTLIWDTFTPPSRGTNPESILFFEDRFERRKMRWFEFRNLARMSGDPAGLKELQLYGEGYVADVTMTSPLIELGGSRNLTTIEWAEDQPPGTTLDIRTRTGDDLEEVKHFFDNKGSEVTEFKYNALPGFAKGPIETEVRPGPGWSAWSRAYSYSGETIGSPSPRRFVKVQVRFTAEDPLAASSISSLLLNFRPPLVRRAVGEISPSRDVGLGRVREFVAVVRVEWEPGDPGFDRIRIDAPAGVSITPEEVLIGNEDAFLLGEMRTFPVSPDSGMGARALVSDPNVLWLQLPETHTSAEEDLMLVRFRGALFMSGTEFQVSLGNSSLPSAWQRVDSGDATYLTSSRSLTVLAEMKRDILSNVQIWPNPFTPNGDGVNDTAEIQFEVTKVNATVGAEVRIFTLDGRSVRALRETWSHPGGMHRFEWRGEGDEGGR